MSDKKISDEDIQRLTELGIDVEDELARILKEEIMIEFAKIGVTQADIDKPMIEALKNLMKDNKISDCDLD